MSSNFRSTLLLFHYWFPIALGWSVVVVIHHATGLPILSSGLCLYLLGICAAYSLDRVLDSDDKLRPQWLKTSLMLGFSISSIIGIFLAFKGSVQMFSALLVFSIIALLYRRIKRVPFLKFLVVSIVWVWAGVALPFANSNCLHGSFGQ